MIRLLPGVFPGADVAFDLNVAANRPSVPQPTEGCQVVRDSLIAGLAVLPAPFGRNGQHLKQCVVARGFDFGSGSGSLQNADGDRAASPPTSQSPPINFCRKEDEAFRGFAPEKVALTPVRQEPLTLLDR